MSILFDRYKKEILILIGAVFFVVALSTFITYRQLNDSLNEIYANKLSVLKNSLSTHVKEYFKENEKILLTLSSSYATPEALKDFTAAFDAVEKEYKKEGDTEALKKAKTAYLSKINFSVPNAPAKRELDEYLPKNKSSQTLQELFIAKNPFGTNDKYMLYSSKENLSYDIQHKKYHPYFINELKRYGFYDILLINLNGDIIYSAFKENDFATNLLYGVYKESSLAETYKKALKSDFESVVFGDFTAYEPSYDKPAAFMATPVFSDGKKIGVIAMQLSISEINRVMTLNESQEEIGLGYSGEAYLVGSDYYMRSNSRFMSTIGNRLVDELSTTVGIIKVDTPSVKRALNGESSYHIKKDYRGITVFSSFAPMDVLDKKWAILVEIDSKEVHESINSTTRVIIFTSIVLTMLFLMLLGYLFLKLILKPMEKNESILAENILLKNNALDSVETLLDEYKRAVDTSSIVSKTTPNGVITYVNDAFCEISGYTREELIGQPHNIVRHPDMSKESFKDMWETILHRRVYKAVIKNRKKDGSAYYVNSTISPILDRDGKIKEFISIRSDITELTNKEKQILEQTTDLVTSLPNRQKMIEDIDDFNHEMKLAIIQIDKFKEVNDFYGVETGDSLLINISLILKKIVAKDKVTIYKVNGDEFAILEFGATTVEEFTKTVSNVIKYFDHNVVVVDDDNFNIAVNVGVAAGKKENLFFNAEMTLRKAIESSKPLLSYKSSNEKEYHNNISMTTKIKDAIKNDKIVIYAQPIVSNTPNSKEKFECLIRMIDGDKVISPHFFLDIAKKARLYPTLTKIVIEKSFNHFMDSKSEFSINLNIEDILDDNIVLFLKRKIEEYRLGHRLVIELVESEGIENFEHIDGFIKEVKKLGCKIAIDDFGTGYSNFEYLMKLNADFIKIDGSLIKNLDCDENSKVVVELIVAFAKRMNIKTIGEFVHNDAVYQIVKEMGIDYTQGYYLGEPVPL